MSLTLIAMLAAALGIAGVVLWAYWPWRWSRHQWTDDHHVRRAARGAMRTLDGKVGRLSRKPGAAIDCSGPLRALRRNGEFRYDYI